EKMPQALDTSIQIAEMVDLELSLGKAHFPIFNIPGNLEPMDYLTQKANDGLAKRFKEATPELRERLDYELSVIAQKKYATYFLIVADFMNWAKEHEIITNTRGSAAGSLVLYAIGVTDIDPIFYRLPFERFLNPYRPSLPDIDCDMADDRRDEVIKYVMERYGHDKVAHIVTFGTMMGRAAVRDIGRVLGIPYGEVDRIAKLVPPPHQGFHKPLEEAIKEVPELLNLYNNDQSLKILLDLAKRVEGTVRHASVHAAGIVIAPVTLTEFTPLMREANGEKIVTQYDMFSVGEDGVGLVKMDFLGIRNLSILGHSVKIVKENRGIEVDLTKIPIDDKKTFELLSRGETMGLFQLEGDGMTRYLVELKPTNIFDIMAMIALYRPGPLAIIPEYISRKRNPSKITYFDERMRDILERSLGLLVYQDDVLLTAITLAGYNWEEVDKFRKAMGKKIPEEMAKQKDHFIEGCIKGGLTEGKALEIFKLIEPFAAYGFNKAHAASYSTISYQTAYMKANYSEEFMAAVMTAEYGDIEKIAHAMEECKRMGIVVLPPNVNRSKVGFTIEDLDKLSEDDLKRSIGAVFTGIQKQGIRFGLSAIKNVGILAIESIIKARDKNAFSSLGDLCGRVDNRLVNRKTLEALIKAGGLDSLGSRAAQMISLDQCLELAHARSKKASSGQVGLFGVESQEEIVVALPEVDEWDLDQMLIFEKELLGFYLHEPRFLAKLSMASKYATKSLGDVTEGNTGERILVAALIADARKVITKKSAAEMAFIRLTDTKTTLDAVIFPKTYLDCKTYVEKDKVVLVWAKVETRDESLSLIVDRMIEYNPDTFDPTTINVGVSEAVDVVEKKRYYPKSEDKSVVKKEKEIEIHVPKDSGVDILQKVNKTLREYPGKVKVSILLPNGGNNLKKLDLPFGIKVDPSLVSQLETLLGKGTIRLT
ncbi:MAG: DNA polymerase III subunit alpha, partial [Candidatus Daviesbacteria bacterium]|nr:DNA polymerase III subunit alpha [Candidatus Daviesbacteria bacterium]